MNKNDVRLNDVRPQDWSKSPPSWVYLIHKLKKTDAIMAARHDFRKLTIWKDGIVIVKKTYAVTKNFPKSEIYALSSQMQRSSVSIPSNIAEGTSKGTDKHFSQYLEFIVFKTFSIALN